MKVVSTLFELNDTFYISSFGYESISKNAHWGKGRRENYFLHYVLEGEGYFNDHKVKSGEGFLITPSQLHEYHSSSNKPWKYFFVMFNGADIPLLCKKHIETNKHNIFKYDFKPKLLDLCDSIFAAEGPLSELEALSFFFQLFSFHEKKNNITGNRYVKEAKKYMNINFYRNVSITEVSDAIGVDDRYLYNLFIKHENMSPKKYLTNLKLNRAKHMLKNTNSPISEIAISTGFQDALSFSRFFSKNIGYSPSMYRKINNTHKQTDEFSQ